MLHKLHPGKESGIDNDIVIFDVYFDTTTPPTMLEGNTSTTTINVAAAVNTYYWRVVTKDSQGNSSQSEIFEFTIE